ncbi:pentatricopeptide repeat-containing protein 2, mitochondrial-like [Contarinia nasturtii]|uniref:pentatricopeptide repeat-containing protein 2, mitochondrial-like n=1 Tax=Contarinia nasturtii TaxID=265458 RepID=UPI0012D48784|nr:pentatricopeptide repeat-containing protein 2, mitochondrial-like [Contarinia nasturtii]
METSHVMLFRPQKDRKFYIILKSCSLKKSCSTMNYLSCKSILQLRAMQKQWMIGSVRTLFTKSFLGIEDYEVRRSTQLPFDPKAMEIETKAGKMARFMKYWVHVMKRDECVEKFSEIQTNLQLIHSDEKQMKAFNFGTVVMRMFHYHDLPNQALKIFNNEQIPLMFDKLESKFVLLDLLFNHKMYEDVLHIIKINHEKQEKVQKGMSPQLNCLALAACYKLNTEEHLKYGLQFWNKLPKEKQLFQSGTFLSMLAINLGQPNIALEILESNIQQHFVQVFVRLIALADCGYFVEAAQLIEGSKRDFPKITIYDSVVERIEKSLEKYPASEEKTNFSKLLDTIPIYKQNNYSIDELLCLPINRNRGLTPEHYSPNYIGYKKDKLRNSSE